MDQLVIEEMIEHDLIQGSQEWLEFRLTHDGASEAAAMLGLSKKVKRNELLHMKATGITKEFSAWVQENILDHGHEVEAMARPIVEKQIGTKLYPVVCSLGRMSASCDGKNMAGNAVWEHKQRNEELFASVAAGVLPDEHWPQVQQVLMVTGADRCIFTVSDGTEENMVSMEVLPDAEKFERIRAGWAQFHIDREEYLRKLAAGEIVQHKEMPKAEVTIDLPALFVHAKGEITTHNMDEFGMALTAKLAEVRAIALVDDQDFSNAKEAAKKFRETAKSIALSQKQMLAQTETIGEASLKMEAWVKDLNATALQLEKDVEKEDLAKKTAMVTAAGLQFHEHVEALEAYIRPIKLNLTRPDFGLAIKGKRSYASMQDAVDTTLSQAKSAASAQAKDVSTKLAWCKEHAAGMSALFPDLQQIISKPMEDFTLTITSRIEKQKAEEAARLETERTRMEADAKAKAEAEAAIKLKADEERIRAEERAKAEAEARSKAEAELSAKAETQPQVELTAGVPLLPDHDNLTALEKTKPAVRPAVAWPFPTPDMQKNTATAAPVVSKRPSDGQIIEALALHFRVHEMQVISWLIEVDIEAASTHFSKEFA